MRRRFIQPGPASETQNYAIGIRAQRRLNRSNLWRCDPGWGTEDVHGYEGETMYSTPQWGPHGLCELVQACHIKDNH